MLKLVCNLDQVELEFVEKSVLVLVYLGTHSHLFHFHSNQHKMDMFLFAQVCKVTYFLLVGILQLDHYCLNLLIGNVLLVYLLQ